MLLEALGWPILLCSLDTYLSQALRRSLRAGSKETAGEFSHHAGVVGRQRHHHGSSNRLIGGQPELMETSISPNASHSPGAPTRQIRGSHYLANCNKNDQNFYLDFMYICGKPASAHGQTDGSFELVQGSSRQSDNPSKAHLGRISSTCPPIPFEASTPDDSLRANFKLMTRRPIGNSKMFGCDQFIGTAELVASRRARCREMNKSKKSGDRTRRRRSAGEASSSSMNILGLAKRILIGRSNRIMHPKSRMRANRRSASVSRLFDFSASSSSPGATISTTETNGGSSSSGDASFNVTGRHLRSSPTSSLSTLIRKFNHDNYTSICQQYNEQREKLTAKNTILAENDVNESDESFSVLIDELDPPKPTTGKSLNQNRTSIERDRNELTQATSESGALCRRGGLQYSFYLGEELSQTGKAVLKSETQRVNPLLAVTASKRGQALPSLSRSSELPRLDGNEASDSSDRLLSQNKAEKSRKIAVMLTAVNKRLSHKSESSDKQENPRSMERNESKTKNLEENVEREPKSKPLVPALVAEEGRETKLVASQTHENNYGSDIRDAKSVQELLSKMNGLIGQQLSESTVPGKPNESEQTRNNINWARESQRNRTKNKKQQEHLRHPDKVLKDGARQYLDQSCNFDTLDYASLHSVDDALSLVSVSSEFEYHNILQGPQQTPTGGSKSKRVPCNSSSPKPKIEPQLSRNSDGGATNVSTKSDDTAVIDMRFPSFYVSSGQQKAALQKSGFEVEPARITSKDSPRTASKPSKVQASKMTTDRLDFQSQASKIAKPNQTIIKQKAGNDTRRHVRVSEFGWKHQHSVGSLATKVDKNSLPAENGNVKARIRKFQEHQQQLQSTPNLSANSSERPTVKPTSTPPNSRKASLIPKALGSAHSVVISRATAAQAKQIAY